MDRLQLVQVILLFAAVTCLKFVDSTEAPAQEIFCSIPPAKQAERGTITCCFKNVPISNASMTVNARGVKLADFETDLVLALEFPNTDYQKTLVDDHFEFENVSSSDGVNWNVSVHIPESTQAYQGDYDCQLVGANTPSPATCHFILDTLTEQVQNTFVSLRVEPQNVTDVEDKYTIRRVDFKSEGSDTNTIIFDPPETNVSLTSLNNDTKYEVTVYLGKPLIPVTRSICIPTVRNLRVQTLKSNKQRLDWDEQPVCLDSVAYSYKVCYEEADPDVPRNHQCFYSHIRAATISDLTVGSKYKYDVRVAFNSGGHGPLTTLEAEVLPYKPKADESSPWDVGYVMLAICLGAAVCGGIIVRFAPKIYHCIVKRLKRKECDGHIDEKGDQQTPLLAQKSAVGVPKPEPDMGDGPSLGQVAGHQNIRVEIPANDIIDGQPAGPTSGTVSGPENRPRHPPYVQAEVHPIATPPSGSINNKPAVATPDTSLSSDVPPMEVPNSQEEQIVSMESEVSSSGEARHDLTPDSGCEQETEPKRELQKSYQDLERDLQAKVDEIIQLTKTVQESDDGLKALREECEKIKRDSRQQLADKEKDFKITTERQQREHRREKTEMNDRFSKLTDEVKKSGKKLEASKRQCSRLQSSLKERNEQLKNLQENSDKRITELESKLSLCMSLIASKDRDAQENVKRYEQQLQEANAELCRSRQRIGELESEYRKLQKELSTHEQLIKKLQPDPSVMQSFQELEERVHSLTVQQHEQAQQLQAMPQKMMKVIEEKLIRLDPETPTQHKYSDKSLNEKDEEGATGGSELGSPEPLVSGNEFQQNRTPFAQGRFSPPTGVLSIRPDRPRACLRGDGYDLNQPLQAGHSNTSAQGIQGFEHVSPQAQSDDVAAYVSGPQNIANTQSVKTEGSTAPSLSEETSSVGRPGNE